MRIGTGFDVHRFGDEMPGHHIMLGGVRVPHSREVLAHSDGDVILHAICDAILGALADGDIGKHFPDSDSAYRGADSRELLRTCYGRATGRNLSLANADVTLIAESPKVRQHVDAMRQVIAGDLGVDVSQISIKATTTEQLGFIGRGEGLAAQAVVLLV